MYMLILAQAAKIGGDTLGRDFIPSSGLTLAVPPFESVGSSDHLHFTGPKSTPPSDTAVGHRSAGNARSVVGDGARERSTILIVPPHIDQSPPRLGSWPRRSLPLVASSARIAIMLVVLLCNVEFLAGRKHRDLLASLIRDPKRNVPLLLI